MLPDKRRMSIDVVSPGLPISGEKWYASIRDYGMVYPHPTLFAFADTQEEVIRLVNEKYQQYCNGPNRLDRVIEVSKGPVVKTGGLRDLFRRK